MKTQRILTDAKLASLLKWMGYPVTAKPDALGTQYLVQDPGDLQEAIDAYESGAQVADSKGLLTTYDELRGQSQSDESDSVMSAGKEELRPAKKSIAEGREFTTRDFRTANLLLYAGYALLRSRVEGGRAVFLFEYDAELKEIVSKFNRGLLLVEPSAWLAAGFKVRDAIRTAKEQNFAMPVSLSNASGERD